MKYRLGLDMGATSLGWAVFDIERNELKNYGVRIFDDGREDKTKASLCVKRRQARGMRRLQTRKHIQMQALLKALLKYGLLPMTKQEREEMKKLNPYELRTKALDTKMTLFEIGRIFISLSQRKGFLSNRKDNKEEGGKLKEGYQLLLDEMKNENARTYGEFLYKKQQTSYNAILRLKHRFDDKGKFTGGTFPFRQTYRDEFKLIFDKQQQFYPNLLTQSCRNEIEGILFFQRPLKTQEEGFCTFEFGEKRIPKAHPLFQQFRFWQHVLNLKFFSKATSDYERLTEEQIKNLVHILQNPADYISTKEAVLTYANIKKLLGLDKNGLFNYENQFGLSVRDQKGILADTTAYAIMKTENLSQYWRNFSDEEKSNLINILSRPENYINFPKTKRSIEDDDKLIIKYLCDHFGLSDKAAEELLYEAELEDGFASLSEKAIRKILPHLQAGKAYEDACQEAGYHHSYKEHQKMEFLPYYGNLLQHHCLGQKNNPKNEEERYGKINNATVHVALNQVRHLVNEIITVYGKPFDISIEYARDLNASTTERAKMTNTRNDNEAENTRIKKELEEKTNRSNLTDRDIEKYKIWKNMGIPKGADASRIRECPFTGDIISVSDLMNGERFQIEHLIPFSRSLDNSYNNRVIAASDANYRKSNQTPWEAFHNCTEGRYNWDEIQRRIKKLPLEQQWRFGKDAMKKFEEQEGPIARSLNDTRYMTRILQEYLLPIVREDGKKTVQAVVGQLTAMVRKSWGLNLYKSDKESEDYRLFHNHHAIDAIVVAALNRTQIETTAYNLKQIPLSVKTYFKTELNKFYDKTISKEEKIHLHKLIRDFTKEREAAIVKDFIPLPENFCVPDLLEGVANINISHKPKLKDIKDKNSTVGQLHEDTAYGLKSFVDNDSLAANFKTGHGDKKKTPTKDVTEYIPMFYNKEDKKAYYDAFKAWFIIEGKAKTLNVKTAAERQIKNDLENKEKETIQALRSASKKAFKWFIGGANFCAEIYQINPNNKICGIPTKDAGEWKSEIISNYNATVRVHRNEEIFYWKERYPNAKRIMTLKRNDMVLATFTKEQAFGDGFPKGIQQYVQQIFQKNPNLTETKVLFRVKKMSTDGRLCLTPHNIAKEDGDSKSWTPCASSLQKYHAQKVLVSPMGRILNAK